MIIILLVCALPEHHLAFAYLCEFEKVPKHDLNGVSSNSCRWATSPTL